MFVAGMLDNLMVSTMTFVTLVLNTWEVLEETVYLKILKLPHSFCSFTCLKHGVSIFCISLSDTSDHDFVKKSQSVQVVNCSTNLNCSQHVGTVWS